MANEISAEFTGNIGATAEQKTSASGKTYITFNVAVTPSKKINNEWVDGETMWIRVTSFDETLDALDYVKGTRVHVGGRLTQRTADNGKTYNDVVADEIEILKRDTKPATPNTWRESATTPVFGDDETPF